MAKQEQLSYSLGKAPLSEISTAIEQRVRQERILDEGALHPLNANPKYAEAGPIYGYAELLGEISERITKTTDEYQIDAVLEHYESTQEILGRDTDPQPNQLSLERAISQQTFDLARRKAELAARRAGSQAIKSAISGYIPGFS
jgi:hypothetical protein